MPSNSLATMYAEWSGQTYLVFDKKDAEIIGLRGWNTCLFSRRLGNSAVIADIKFHGGVFFFNVESDHNSGVVKQVIEENFPNDLEYTIGGVI